MKRSLKILMFLAFAVFLMAGNAMALSFDQDYWTTTDLTTGNDGESTFFLLFEDASYESDFGLYTIDIDNNTNLKSIDKEFLVFNEAQNPVSKQAVYFKIDTTGWNISLDQINWNSFENTFGFYFVTYADDGSTYKWYTDILFNDDGLEHVGTVWDGTSIVDIYLDDQNGGGDRDFNDMEVTGTDLAPVPEPATMLLFGSGLVGLVGFGRKKFLKKGKNA